MAMDEPILGGAWNTTGPRPFLTPDISTGPSVSSPAPDPPGRYPCPCCGWLTFPVPRERALAFICPVCLWENDLFTPQEDAPSDENRGMTLRQGREQYRRLGAVRADLIPVARPPRPEEVPDSQPGAAPRLSPSPPAQLPGTEETP